MLAEEMELSSLFPDLLNVDLKENVRTGTDLKYYQERVDDLESHLNDNNLPHIKKMNWRR